MDICYSPSFSFPLHSDAFITAKGQFVCFVTGVAHHAMKEGQGAAMFRIIALCTETEENFLADGKVKARRRGSYTLV